MKLAYFTSDKDFPFFIQFGKHEGSMFMHAHQDFSELVVVLEGSATHQVDDEEFGIGKGDVFVINRGTSHGYVNLNNFKICNIMFDYDYMFSGAADIRASSGFHALFVVEPSVRDRRFRSRLRLSDEELGRVGETLKLMSEEYAFRKTGYISFLKAEFMKLAIFLSRRYERFETALDRSLFGIARAAAGMEADFAEEFPVGRMAELAGMSVRHFTRVFTDTYGIPPSKYLEKIRMNKAKILLQSSAMTITEIAFACGFSDNNYFTRRFKTLFQITPSQYRRL